MVFENEASWTLFWLNVVIYLLMTFGRMQVDIWLPARYFNPDGWWYRIRPWERGGDFYRDTLRIDRWKDKVPAVDSWNRFSKKRLAGAGTIYLRRFVIETCRGESNHLRAVLSTLPMRLWTPLDLWMTCFLIALLGNLPFILIQRYNRPRLLRTLDRIERRALESAPGDGDPELRPATA